MSKNPFWGKQSTHVASTPHIALAGLPPLNKRWVWDFAGSGATKPEEAKRLSRGKVCPPSHGRELLHFWTWNCAIWCNLLCIPRNGFGLGAMYYFCFMILPTGKKKLYLFLFVSRRKHYYNICTSKNYIRKVTCSNITPNASLFMIQ